MRANVHSQTRKLESFPIYDENNNNFSKMSMKLCQILCVSDYTFYPLQETVNL